MERKSEIEKKNLKLCIGYSLFGNKRSDPLENCGNFFVHFIFHFAPTRTHPQNERRRTFVIGFYCAHSTNDRLQQQQHIHNSIQKNGKTTATKENYYYRECPPEQGPRRLSPELRSTIPIKDSAALGLQLYSDALLWWTDSIA